MKSVMDVSAFEMETGDKGKEKQKIMGEKRKGGR